MGARPTFADGAGDSVEAHILHPYPADFYGATLSLLLLGHLRPELRFDGPRALVARIRADIGTAAAQLEAPGAAAAREAHAGWLAGE